MGFELNCPSCGKRSYHEFWFGGELRRWSPDPTVSEEYETTWLRANKAGPQLERWFHFAGCRRWLTVGRDTRSNEIVTIAENQERSLLPNQQSSP